jgi:hypothetical protein
MDKFVNATKILDSIDAALKQFRLVRNGKSERFLTNFVTLGVLKNMIKNEIQHREFRPVVHAHWIEHEADFGESLYCECSSCHDSTGIECKLFCGACGAIMDEQTIMVKDY